jgi:cytochrome P450
MEHNLLAVCITLHPKRNEVQNVLTMSKQFGAGSRSCIGKNISLLEMTKLVPSLVKRFDFVPADEEEWTTHSGWFVKQSIDVRVVDRMR